MLRAVSVLSIESLGVKLEVKNGKEGRLTRFSTLYRVVGGETITDRIRDGRFVGFSTLYRVVGGETLCP